MCPTPLGKAASRPLPASPADSVASTALWSWKACGAGSAAMPRRVVVTGIGMVTPRGMHPGPLWERLCQGSPGGAAIRRFDATPFTVSEAGEVDEDLPLPLPPRLTKRMDRYCVLAMAAAQLALDDSALDVATEDPDGVGISIGNMYGGWGITDPSLRGLLQEGYASVSPYVASAWFPTAPQGQMSIFWGLRGYAKTIAADAAGGAAAIGYAARAIQDGHADVMLAGGAEAPVTPYAYAFCQVSGVMGDAYRPFDRRAEGFRVGEGAAILILEEEERAAARGARTYGEVAGWSTGHVGGPEPRRGGRGGPRRGGHRCLVPGLRRHGRPGRPPRRPCRSRGPGRYGRERI